MVTKNKIFFLLLTFNIFNYSFTKKIKKQDDLIGQYTTTIASRFSGTDGIGTLVVKLYDIGDDRYSMVYHYTTYKDAQDSLSLWFFNALSLDADAMASDCNVIECHDNKTSWLVYKKPTSFMTVKNEQINKAKKHFKDKEIFFRVLEFHKAPITRPFGYMMYSKNKNSCYKKFKESFGEEALEKFKKSI